VVNSRRRHADAPELESAISRIAAAGKTALYDAIIEAPQRLKLGKRDKKAVIVVRDGGDNASTHSLPEVMKTAEESSVIIYAIGLFDEGLFVRTDAGYITAANMPAAGQTHWARRRRDSPSIETRAGPFCGGASLSCSPPPA
jgi:hypothetical protein